MLWEEEEKSKRVKEEKRKGGKEEKRKRGETYPAHLFPVRGKMSIAVGRIIPHPFPRQGKHIGNGDEPPPRAILPRQGKNDAHRTSLKMYRSS